MKAAGEPLGGDCPSGDRNAIPGSRTPTVEARRLLIVDDSRIVQDFLAEIISDLQVGFRIVSATDGEMALRLFDEERPEVVLLDISLPELNGFDLLAEMKLRRPACAVIMLTGDDYPEFRANALRLGADFFIGKTTDFWRIPGLLTLLARPDRRSPR